MKEPGKAAWVIRVTLLVRALERQAGVLPSWRYWVLMFTTEAIDRR